MNTPLISGLLTFLRAQPADRPISSHRTWNGCIVGDYAREVHGHEIAMPGPGDNYAPVWADPILRALHHECGTEEGDLAEVFGTFETDEQAVMDVFRHSADLGTGTYGEMIEQLECEGFEALG